MQGRVPEKREFNKERAPGIWRVLLESVAKPYTYRVKPYDTEQVMTWSGDRVG